MNIHKMKNKYIAVLCFTMGTLADNSTSGLSDGTSEGISTIAPSAFSLRATGTIPNTDNLKMVQNVVTTLKLSGSAVNPLQEIPESSFGALRYTVAHADVANASTTKSTKLTITYPDQLTPDSTTLASIISFEAGFSGKCSHTITSATISAPNSVSYPGQVLEFSFTINSFKYRYGIPEFFENVEFSVSQPISSWITS